jgi:hypothetical protein
MKRLSLALVLGLALAGATAAFGLAAHGKPPRSARMLIRHQLRGCHAWSVDGGPFRAAQRVTIRRGGALAITNDDVMPHRLVQLGGPRVRMHNGDSMPMHMGRGDDGPGRMDHMGATTKITFSKAGTYRFKTVAGEDYMSGFRTIGPDNLLRLTVTVR